MKTRLVIDRDKPVNFVGTVTEKILVAKSIVDSGLSIVLSCFKSLNQHNIKEGLFQIMNYILI